MKENRPRGELPPVSYPRNTTRCRRCDGVLIDDAPYLTARQQVPGWRDIVCLLCGDRWWIPKGDEAAAAAPAAWQDGTLATRHATHGLDWQALVRYYHARGVALDPWPEFAPPPGAAR